MTTDNTTQCVKIARNLGKGRGLARAIFGENLNGGVNLGDKIYIDDLDHEKTIAFGKVISVDANGDYFVVIRSVAKADANGEYLFPTTSIKDYLCVVCRESDSIELSPTPQGQRVWGVPSPRPAHA